MKKLITAHSFWSFSVNLCAFVGVIVALVVFGAGPVWWYQFFTGGDQNQKEYVCPNTGWGSTVVSRPEDCP